MFQPLDLSYNIERFEEYLAANITSLDAAGRNRLAWGDKSTIYASALLGHRFLLEAGGP